MKLKYEFKISSFTQRGGVNTPITLYSDTPSYLKRLQYTDSYMVFDKRQFTQYPFLLDLTSLLDKTLIFDLEMVSSSLMNESLPNSNQLNIIDAHYQNSLNNLAHRLLELRTPMTQGSSDYRPVPNFHLFVGLRRKQLRSLRLALRAATTNLNDLYFHLNSITLSPTL